mmetsp:Transcript_50766/g.127369  ORF Transcript_50766/g.127369 Transcript_50766/m.127369 type:complete len:137 (-) Transcript_50766:645-1055(-)
MTAFQRLVKKGKYDAMLNALKGMTPSGIHVALSQLGPLAGGTIKEIISVLGFFEHYLDRRDEADLIQTLLYTFLQFHHHWLFGDPDPSTDPSEHAALVDVASRVVSRVDDDWKVLDHQFQHLFCSIKLLTHLQMET